ncbi:alpha/beta hydrolase fold domain-containing protein [Marinactinospora thermotolerans]|uniref:alpha/beta hydrolase fold domain-containing protein n=1 Tax=Marinactinospora thermotolerans TaxID=531310 RepID=UPI003D92793F
MRQGPRHQRRPATGSARRRWRVLAMAVAALCAAALAVVAFTILSRWLPPALLPLSPLLTRHDLHVVPFALAGVGVGALAVLAGARRTGGLTMAVAASTAVVALLPVAASWRTAEEQDVPLSLAAYLAPDPERGPDESDVVYGHADGRELRLDVYRPRGGGRTPAIVHVHGGAWIGGDKAEFPGWPRRLADQGYTVFSVDYRLAPPERWRDAPGDVRCALNWVTEHAADYGADPGRVVLSGSSAGGHLALMAAYADDTIPPTCGDGDTAVAAVLALYPVADIAAWWRTETLGYGGAGRSRPAMRAYTGGTPAEVPGAYELGSPGHYVRPGLPPTLILHGGRDHTVPPEPSERLAGRLAAAGVPTRFVRLPFAEHGFDVAQGSWADQIAHGVTTRFLAEHAPPRDTAHGDR